MEELRLMVCPKLGTDGVVTDEGWGQTACVECGCDVHLSPDAKRVMREHAAMPVCSACSIKMTAAAGHIEKVMPVGDWGDDPELIKQAEELYQEAAKLRSAGGPDIPVDRLLSALRTLQEGVMDGMDNFEAMKLTAAAAGEHMPPHGEWGSICVIEDYEGNTFPPIPFGEVLSKGVPKEVVARQMIPAMIHAAAGKRVIFGISSWMVYQEPPAPGEKLPEFEMPESGTLEDHPDAKEALVIIDITADGVQQMASAVIERDGINPPKLGEWKDVPAPAETDGLFVQAVIPVLQLIRSLRGESVGS